MSSLNWLPRICQSATSLKTPKRISWYKKGKVNELTTHPKVPRNSERERSFELNAPNRRASVGPFTLNETGIKIYGTPRGRSRRGKPPYLKTTTSRPLRTKSEPK
ncbi:unnamed protein product, partial [Nesidiocoris tenuis]